MKTVRFRLMIATLCVLLVTGAARSQAADAASAPPAHSHRYGMRRGMGFFAGYLNLSEAQQAQMKDILAKERPGLKPLYQQLQQTRQQLKQYEQGAYDEAKVRTLAAQQSQAMVELAVQKTRIHSELFQVLNPDQQAKMKEVQARREARMQRHMHAATPEAPEAPAQP
ncbi:MAG TPA: Spy/CpxP family protein refolding chaperone [Candidatus Sulfotelmatobacter sp.]